MNLSFELIFKILDLNPNFKKNGIDIFLKKCIDKYLIALDDIDNFIKLNDIANAKILVTNYYDDFEAYLFFITLKIDLPTCNLIVFLLRKNVINLKFIIENKNDINAFYQKWFKSLNKYKLTYENGYQKKHYKIIVQDKNHELTFYDNFQPLSLYIIRDNFDFIHYADFSKNNEKIVTIIEQDFMSNIKYSFLDKYSRIVFKL